MFQPVVVLVHSHQGNPSHTLLLQMQKVKKKFTLYVGTLDLHNCEIIQFGAAGAPSFSSIKKTYIFEQKLRIAPMHNNNMHICT